MATAGVIDPAAVVVPEDAGHVVSVHRAVASAKTGTTPTIIHIQDAHTNYQAQRHLAAIVDALAKQYGIQLVFVEGSDGNASVSYLRQYAPLDKRTTVADEFLKAGKMSGEEYLDIIADYPLTLWGIESERLYDENLKAFLGTESVREQAKPVLERLRGVVEQAAQRRYPAELRQLEAWARDYEEGALAFTNYLQRLEKLLTAAGLTLESYPALHAFRQAQALETQLDLDAVQRDQTKALRALQGRLASDRYSALMAQAQEMQQGTLSPTAFYDALERTLLEAELRTAVYPHLTRYLEHLKLSNRLDTAQLAKELDRCAQSARRALATDPEVRALQQLQHDVTVLSRLFELGLTPDEYLAFAAQLEKTSLRARWEPSIRALGMDETLLQSLPQIEAGVPQVAQFYTIARRRNHAMVDRAVAKIREMNAPAAILIAGGFHTPHLTKMLTERGINVVVVAPTVTEETDEQLYHHILKTQRKIPPPTYEEEHPPWLVTQEARR